MKKKAKCSWLLLVLLAVLLMGCSANSLEKEIESKSIELINAMVKYSLCNKEVEEELNQRIDAYIENSDEEIVTIDYKDVWPEYFEEHEQIFAEFVTADCYEKMFRNRTFTDPSFVSDDCEILINYIEFNENSIFVSCDVSLDHCDKTMLFTFTENDRNYLVSGMKIENTD